MGVQRVEIYLIQVTAAKLALRSKANRGHWDQNLILKLPKARVVNCNKTLRLLDTAPLEQVLMSVVKHLPNNILKLRVTSSIPMLTGSISDYWVNYIPCHLPKPLPVDFVNAANLNTLHCGGWQKACQINPYLKKYCVISGEEDLGEQINKMLHDLT